MFLKYIYIIFLHLNSYIYIMYIYIHICIQIEKQIVYLLAHSAQPEPWCDNKSTSIWSLNCIIAIYHITEAYIYIYIYIYSAIYCMLISVSFTHINLYMRLRRINGFTVLCITLAVLDMSECFQTKYNLRKYIYIYTQYIWASIMIFYISIITNIYI